MTPISAELLARIRQAANLQDYGHSINLTRLVDGEYTYTASCCGQAQEFPDMEEARTWVRQIKEKASEEDLLAALEEHAVNAREEVLTVKLAAAYDFSGWETSTLAQQCRAQACEQLDPEFSGFMVEVAKRLELIVNAAPKCPMCDNTGYKDYAGFVMDLCDCRRINAD